MKSQYQLINRGRKGAPVWVVEKDGKAIFSDSDKVSATGFLKVCRANAK